MPRAARARARIARVRRVQRPGAGGPARPGSRMCGVQCAVMTLCCSVCDGYVYFSEHTIEWKDGRSENWSVNLMACRMIKEGRFVQPSDDVDEFLK